MATILTQPKPESVAALEQQIADLTVRLESAVQMERAAEIGVTGGTEPDDGEADPERDIARQQRLRKGFFPYLFEYSPLVILTAPVIYSTFVALVILDIFITIYQWTCFPVYGIPRVKRREFIVIDRHQLSYLNALEKFNCVFCGYANGLLAYGVEIASLTEQFWCPIKHAARTKGQHPRSFDFARYSDAASYRQMQKARGQQSKAAACRLGRCQACKK